MNPETQRILSEIASANEKRKAGERSRMSAVYPRMTEAQENFMRHIGRWGSSAYPVQKIGRNWQWIEFCSIPGAPTVYKTKHECVAAIENYVDFLHDLAAGRL